uniref:Uncharacterized protein n=1 Tax=Streptomyces sp. FR1 TaxID=349971 RepID=V9Z6T5_9ACTN|nr:hypothetical protein pFRL3_319 [Streptomyces sp. FR1]
MLLRALPVPPSVPRAWPVAGAGRHPRHVGRPAERTIRRAPAPGVLAAEAAVAAAWVGVAA